MATPTYVDTYLDALDRGEITDDAIEAICQQMVAEGVLEFVPDEPPVTDEERRQSDEIDADAELAERYGEDR